MTERIPYSELHLADKMIIDMVEDDTSEGISMAGILSTAVGAATFMAVEVAQSAELNGFAADGLVAGVLVGAATFALIKRRYNAIAPKVDPESR